jgi:hypothetical protein
VTDVGSAVLADPAKGHQNCSDSTVETALGQRWQSLLRAHHRHSGMARHSFAPRSAVAAESSPHYRYRIDDRFALQSGLLHAFPPLTPIQKELSLLDFLI